MAPESKVELHVRDVYNTAGYFKHTGVQTHGYLFEFYPKHGIVTSISGEPNTALPVGTTILSFPEALSIANQLGTKFNTHTYDVINRNCNHFSNEFCKAICGQSIPQEYLTQDKRALKDASLAGMAVGTVAGASWLRKFKVKPTLKVVKGFFKVFTTKKN